MDVESQRLRINQLEQEKSSLQSIVLSQERKVSEIHEKVQQETNNFMFFNVNLICSGVAFI